MSFDHANSSVASAMDQCMPKEVVDMKIRRNGKSAFVAFRPHLDQSNAQIEITIKENALFMKEWPNKTAPFIHSFMEEKTDIISSAGTTHYAIDSIAHGLQLALEVLLQEYEIGNFTMKSIRNDFDESELVVIRDSLTAAHRPITRIDRSFQIISQNFSKYNTYLDEMVAALDSRVITIQNRLAFPKCIIYRLLKNENISMIYLRPIQFHMRSVVEFIQDWQAEECRRVKIVFDETPESQPRDFFNQMKATFRIFENDVFERTEVGHTVEWFKISRQDGRVALIQYFHYGDNGPSRLTISEI